MKKLILVLIFVFLMIACNKSTTGPEDPEDPAPTDTIADISIEILNWEQENDGDSHPWGNVQVIYSIKNIGNIPIEEYTIIWRFEWDTLDYFASWSKHVNYDDFLEVEEEKTDTLNSGNLNGEDPVIRVRCFVRDINS